MTIFYPDIANFQSGLIIQPGTVAVCAKASEGTGFKDSTYQNFKAQAAKVGAVFWAYHFLHAGNADAQAAWAVSCADGSPIMIDCEPTTGSRPTVADCLTFAKGVRARGGVCNLVYYPQWYAGGGSLTALRDAGLSLVSSNYTTYSDNGAGWSSYGGVQPVIWQYTDKQSYGGKSVDFNAFKGTAQQLRDLVYGITATPAPAPAPAPTPASNTEEREMFVNIPAGFAYEGHSPSSPTTGSVINHAASATLCGEWGNGGAAKAGAGFLSVSVGEGADQTPVRLRVCFNPDGAGGYGQVAVYDVKTSNGRVGLGMLSRGGSVLLGRVKRDDVDNSATADVPVFVEVTTAPLA